MTDKIKLVQGDQRPRLQLAITDDATGSAVDLSDPLDVVTLEFRKRGATSVAPTIIPTTKVGTGNTGQVYMDWPSASTLAGTPGDYEAQIVVSFNGQRQTVWEVVLFQMRDNFTP